MKSGTVPLSIVALLASCGARQEERRAPPVRPDRPDRAIASATRAELAHFDQGDDLFEGTFRAADGLGPLFIRSSCAACHKDDGRGPGVVGKMVRRDGRALPHGDAVRPYVTADARTPVEPQIYGDGALHLTYRLPPAVFGRGYLDAIDERELERVAEAAARRHGPIRGRAHRIAPRVIGRFGLKARIATVQEFTADAFQGDMGLTSPLRPTEVPNPDGLADDQRAGIDLDASTITAVAHYVRLLEIPPRRHGSARGQQLFAQAFCSLCHVPTLRTRHDYPVPALAGIEAPVYTDLLLHDMGPSLADGVSDGDAGPREWRTAPLMGLRFAPAFLHDGRARTVREAIEAHGDPGSEARPAADEFRRMPPDDQAELLRFVAGL